MTSRREVVGANRSVPTRERVLPTLVVQNVSERDSGVGLGSKRASERERELERERERERERGRHRKQ